MKKTIAALLAVTILLLLLLSGCAGKEADVSLDAILSEIEAAVPMADGFRMTEDDLLDLYGIRAEDIAEQASLASMNGIFPDEVIMIRAKDEESLGRIKEKLEQRLNEVLNQSRSYDPESYAAAQKCAVDIRGLYITLFVSANNETMTKIYSSHF